MLFLLLLVLFHIFILFFVNVLPVFMYVHHMSAWCLQRSENGTALLKLEVGMILSHHVDAGNRTQAGLLQE